MNSLSGLDWGTVPAWLGAGSLLIAFRVFQKDRSNAERAQIDKLGIWDELVPYLADTGDRHLLAQVHVKVKNGSDLPLEVVYVKRSIIVKHPDAQIGAPTIERLPNGGIRRGSRLIPPDEDWHSSSDAIYVPTGDRIDEWEVTCVIQSVTAIDNAGRVWVLKPSSGYRARKAGRRTLKAIHQKRQWKRSRMGMQAWSDGLLSTDYVEE
ncbi:hypothetical protein ACFPFX_19630 [Streptomyces mauvecolor]|uniref:Uncharacterized protein n=1 Tax=Streptomyces mauvecolor TaxID=58345 RepID=A0ABV9UN08_9ACTN